MPRFSLTGILFASVLAMASVAHADPIVNGGFEIGFSGWTVDPASSGSLLFIGGHAHEGADAAWFGAIGSRDDGLSQTFTTVPGEAYTITFWLGHGATDSNNHFGVWWNTTPLLALTNAAKFGQTEFSFVMPATDDQTSIRFAGREVLDYYYLDAVRVTAVPTPEPATLALFLGGIAMVGHRIVRRKKRSDA